MTLRFQISDESPLRRLPVPLEIALAIALLVIAIPHVPKLRDVLTRFNNVFYDYYFGLRPVTDQTNGPVVIVAADEHSANELAKQGVHDWPWPRDTWASVIQYAQDCGAKAVVFDITFNAKSRYADNLDDDATLGQTADQATIPVIFGVDVSNPGEGFNFSPFDPDNKSWKPTVGNVHAAEDVLRTYRPMDAGLPSLAAAALHAIGRGDDIFDSPFSVLYYGPHVRGKDQVKTFKYISAIDVKNDSKPDRKTTDQALRAALRGKIVLVGGIVAGTYDVKPAPVEQGLYPGVEYQATAIVNMLRHEKVEEFSGTTRTAFLFFIAISAALGSGVPRRTTEKFVLSFAAMALPVVMSFGLFRFGGVRWLPPAGPLAAAVMAAGLALLWSYLAEDRKRRFFRKALAQYVSANVADELDLHPERLRISAERREMSVMFTDIAGFTDLSEKLEADALSRMLNFYLEEMSSIVLAENGTVDKYVGDAIMSFWNAPLSQPDHALRACRAALAMHRRELAIGDELTRLGGPGLHTRLGINTGFMAVGNMGCSQKFNYSVLGDPVNLASRLEGQNKAYGTSIIVSQSTAALLLDQFLLRRLDAIRVKGKLKPVLIYELMGESPGDIAQITLARDYEKALTAYQRKDWDAAEKIIIAIQESFPDDGPCKTLHKRIALFRHDPPPADWDGVFVAKEK